MRLSLRSPQAVFCLAAAVTAAAVVDPIVERMSNRGIFGPGSFTDHSNLDVFPAIAVACLLSIAFVLLSARRLLACKQYPPGWLRDSSRAVSQRPVPALFPAVFAAQLSVLFFMETLEQIVVAGHPMGGTIWLGGPVIVSLVLHAAGCLTFTWLLSRALRWSARTLAQVVQWALRAFVILFGSTQTPLLRAHQTPQLRFIEPYLRRLKGRAPPHYLPA